MKNFWLLALVLLSITEMSAQEVTDVFDMSLEEILNVKINVASKTKQTQNQSSGIVSRVRVSYKIPFGD